MLRPAIFIAVSLLAILALTLLGPSGDNATVQPSAAAPQPKSTAANRTKRSDGVPPEFKKAGVCARCHVVSVLEWGVSGHVVEDIHCQKCHGSSRGHVANERNEVKPDRRPRGAAIAKQLCSTCHKTGCPETLQVQSCQKCHHVHALINPSKSPTAKNDRLEKLLARWSRFRKQMATGEQLAGKQDWRAAQGAFREALKLIPGNHRARTRLDMCRRRLDPNLPGFKLINEKFDAETGLAREVSIVGLNLSMLLVPPGEFDLGSDKLPDSRPVHTVRVDAFYLGQSEVTQAQWTSVMGNNPSVHQGVGFKNAERMPVERVSWNDCQEFIRRLNKRVPGGGFRLPSEAEWEYACRSGSREAAQEKLSAYAWFRGNSRLDPTAKRQYLGIKEFAPRPVATRRPNATGFYDMQGNVCEWCSSLSRPYLYRASDGRESQALSGMRIVRGGSFADTAAALDPAFRHSERPHRRFRWNGLRLVRNVPRLVSQPDSKPE